MDLYSCTTSASLRSLFKDPIGDVLTLDMPPDVLAAHDTGGIDPSEDVPVCVEFGVERLEILGLEGVLLRPVRSAIVGRKYLGETFLELAIGDREAVWSARER